MMVRRASVAVGTVLMAVLAAAGLAWACTAVPSIVAVTPADAPPGSPVTVRGQAPGAGRVLEFRWDGVRGPALARAEDKFVLTSFSVEVPIPADATPGVHTIVAVPAGGDPASAGVGSVGRATVEVTGSAPGQGASSGRAPAPVGGARLWGSPVARSTPSGPGTTYVAGLAVLGLGLGGMVSAFGAAALQRRRVPAGSRTH